MTISDGWAEVPIVGSKERNLHISLGIQNSLFDDKELAGKR